MKQCSLKDSSCVYAMILKPSLMNLVDIGACYMLPIARRKEGALINPSPHYFHAILDYGHYDDVIYRSSRKVALKYYFQHF